MPLGCLSCFGAPKRQPETVYIEEKVCVAQEPQYDDTFLHDLQGALSKAPTDGAEVRIAHVVAQVLQHLRARVVRLYGWTPEEVEEGTAGNLVLLAVDWQRPATSDSASSVVSEPADVPGQRVTIPTPAKAPAAPPAGAQGAGAGGGGAAAAALSAPEPLLQQAVHGKTPVIFQYPSPLRSATSPASPLAPCDCASDHATHGATSFAALPLCSGDRLLGVLWIATSPPPPPPSPTSSPGPVLLCPPVLPPLPLCRHVCTSVCMCLLGAVDPEYLSWLAGSLRRVAGSATLQALVGELCEAVSQHVRRRFFLDAVAHAAVVPDARSTVGFMLDHRPLPGGPGGVARWAAAAAAAGRAGGGGGSIGAMPRGALGQQSLRRSDDMSSPVGGGSMGALPRPPGLSHSALRTPTSQNRRPMTPWAEHAPSPATPASAGGATGPSVGRPPPYPDAARDLLRGASARLGTGGDAAAAAGLGAVPSLRAKGFQLSHTLLQRMVTAPAAEAGRGQEGVYGGLTVADCGRHVQDVHQPSRDVCMLMAGGVRGADMTADASDSNIFASERSTGRIAMQSLVLVGVDVGHVAPTSQQQQGQGQQGQGQQGGQQQEGGGGGGAILALYLAFPTKLPPLLVASAHASCRQLLSLMLARLVRRKVSTELAAEFSTLCSGVPGAYAVLPSSTPPPHAAPYTPSAAAGASASHRADGSAIPPLLQSPGGGF
ncbi:hypothetical protein Agub_g2642, partial [Astrephomene gubernaculifera]